MAVPYTFGTATASIPLSQLDSNFATAITLGNTAIQLGNTVTTLNNMTLANVTISSGNITLTNVSATTANVTTANVVTLIVTGNETVQGNTSVTGTITGAKLIPTGTSVTGNGMYLPATNALGFSTAGTNAVYIDASQNVGIGTSSPAVKLDVSGQINAQNFTSASTFGFKNRIINGGMVIDQRNAGASVTAQGFTVDRFAVLISQASKLTVQQNAGSVTPPVGFINYLGVTSSSAYSVTSSDAFTLVQPIEGLNVSDFAWGTANASSVTLSFRVYSSLTGTFGGALKNSANTRSYPFSYTISAANTWENKSVTIAGDTTGTWLTTNGIGIQIKFGLGVGSTLSGTSGAWAATNYDSATGAVSVVGTSGATFYITGVQLEKGSTATSFDFRSYGTELALCQRYYQTGGLAFSGYNTTGGSVGGIAPFAVTMRSTPTVTYTDTLNTNTAAGTSQSNLGSTTYAAGGETTVSATGGYRFARTYTSSAEL
jgi:hypothetical protein